MEWGSSREDENLKNQNVKWDSGTTYINEHLTVLKMPRKFLFGPVAGCDDEKGSVIDHSTNVVDVLIPLYSGALWIQADGVISSLIKEHVEFSTVQREDRVCGIGQNITYFQLDLRRIAVFRGDLFGEFDSLGTVVDTGDVRKPLAEEVKARDAVAAPKIEDGRSEGHQIPVPIKPRQRAVESVLAEPHLALIVWVVGEVG